MPPVKMTRARRFALFFVQFYLVVLFLLVLLRFTLFR
jgi:hypothetical protein